MQHSALLADKDAHVVLVGMKVEIPDWPGSHLPMIRRPALGGTPGRLVRRQP